MFCGANICAIALTEHGGMRASIWAESVCLHQPYTPVGGYYIGCHRMWCGGCGRDCAFKAIPLMIRVVALRTLEPTQKVVASLAVHCLMDRNSRVTLKESAVIWWWVIQCLCSRQSSSNEFRQFSPPALLGVQIRRALDHRWYPCKVRY